MTIAPTGKKISLAREDCVYTIANNKLVRQDVVPGPNMGWPGIFKQLGLEYPYPVPE
jgi:hypothetical protein